MPLHTWRCWVCSEAHASSCRLKPTPDLCYLCVVMHAVQDNSSFIHVPVWSDNTTEVRALTLLSEHCSHEGTDTSSSSSRSRSRSSGGTSHTTAAASPMPHQPGCNVRSVDNTTLMPKLLQEASVATRQPLLVRLLSNVTLGPGWDQAIPIRRPVVMLGATSAVVSVDFGMSVNVLNVSQPEGQIFWQALVLENLAPGTLLACLFASSRLYMACSTCHASSCAAHKQHQRVCGPVFVAGGLLRAVQAWWLLALRVVLVQLQLWHDSALP